LDGILVGQKMNDFKGMCDNSDSHEFLAVVASLHHQTKRCECRFVSQCATMKLNGVPVNQPLNYWHLRLLELLFGIASGGVRQEDRMANLNVVLEGDILDFDSE
jgi:hypothetical protein